MLFIIFAFIVGSAAQLRTIDIDLELAVRGFPLAAVGSTLVWEREALGAIFSPPLSSNCSGVPVLVRNKFGTVVQGLTYGGVTYGLTADIDLGCTVCTDTCVDIKHVGRYDKFVVLHHDSLGGDLSCFPLPINRVGWKPNLPSKDFLAQEYPVVLLSDKHTSKLKRYNITRSDGCESRKLFEIGVTVASFIYYSGTDVKITIVRGKHFVFDDVLGVNTSFCGHYHIVEHATSGIYYSDGFILTKEVIPSEYKTQEEIAAANLAEDGVVILPLDLRISLADIRHIVFYETYIMTYHCRLPLCNGHHIVSPRPVVLDERLCYCLEYTVERVRQDFKIFDLLQRYKRVPSIGEFIGQYRSFLRDEVCDPMVDSYYIGVIPSGYGLLLSERDPRCVDDVDMLYKSDGYREEETTLIQRQIVTPFAETAMIGYVVDKEKFLGRCEPGFRTGCYVGFGILEYQTLTNGFTTYPFNEPVGQNCTIRTLDSYTGLYSQTEVDCTNNCLDKQNIVTYCACEYKLYYVVVVVLYCIFALMVLLGGLIGIMYHHKINAFIGAFTLAGYDGIAYAMEWRKPAALEAVGKGVDQTRLEEIDADYSGKHPGCCATNKNVELSTKLSRCIPASHGGGGGSTTRLLDKTGIYIVACIALLQPCVAQVVYSVPNTPGLNEFLTGVGQAYQYTDLAFQSAIGSKIVAVSGGGVCEGASCNCFVKQLGVKQTIYPGRVLTLRSGCDQIDLIQKLRIENVQLAYSLQYIRTFSGFTWDVSASYTCADIDEDSDDHDFLKTLKVTNSTRRCCANDFIYYKADADLKLDKTITVDVFKTTFEGLDIFYCLQGPFSHSCYYSRSDPGVKFQASKGIKGLPRYIGVVKKNGFVQKILPVVQEEHVTWDSLMQVISFDVTERTITPSGDGVVFDVSIKNCDNLDFRNQDYVVPGFSFKNSNLHQFLDDVRHPELQRVLHEIRLRNVSYDDRHLPSLQVAIEQLSEIPDTTIDFDLQINGPKVVDGILPFTDITLVDCTYSIGNPISSFCTLEVIWQDTTRGCTLEIRSDNVVKYKSVHFLNVFPRYTVYKFGVVVYSNVEELQFQISVDGRPLPKLKTNKVIKYQQVGDISVVGTADVQFTFQTGNSDVDGTNDAVIAVAVIGSLLFLVLAFISCGYSITNGLYYGKLRNGKLFEKCLKYN